MGAKIISFSKINGKLNIETPKSENRGRSDDTIKRAGVLTAGSFEK
jgi:hypothetical protein